MPSSDVHTTEAELSEVVLAVLAEKPDGSATYSGLVREIPNRINLTDADKEASETRPNEAVWEQRVRNITSHKDSPGNYIALGYLEPIPNGLRITDAGRQKVSG